MATSDSENDNFRKGALFIFAVFLQVAALVRVGRQIGAAT